MAGLEWEKLLQTEKIIQTHFPEVVLVGGTAAALHPEHRVSLDVDSVLSDLRSLFPQVLAELEHLAGWKTRRVRQPVLILGHFDGVDVGIRQLIRSAPLETTVLEGITIPTLGEMLRIKGWLIVTRNALRDYIDFCAMADRARDDFEVALRRMDVLYPQPEDADSTTQQLAKMLADPRPYDFDPEEDSLTVWRALVPPWTEWPYVSSYCRNLAARLFDELMDASGEDGEL